LKFVVLFKKDNPYSP